MKAAKLKKKGYIETEKNVETREQYSIKNFIKIVLIIALVFSTFYFITIVVTNNQEQEQEENYTVIDSEKIILSNLFSQKEDKYYVLAIKESLRKENLNESINADYTELYNQYISEYSNNENALTFYKVDLDDAFNKSFIADEENVVSDIDKLKLSDETLMKIENGKITKYYIGHKDITDALKEL